MKTVYKHQRYLEEKTTKLQKIYLEVLGTMFISQKKVDKKKTRCERIKRRE